MGISGIYKEIGPGQRIALSKLAVEHFEKTSKPLRVAIDIQIWLFQIQSSKGGTNPALRTFFYRLLRLISLNIQPLFVFDGPNKPPFKRNKKTGPNVASIPVFLAKQLLQQFGLPFHKAPGEAEAECALLQREGIVDAVLSEDVDTLMFGSGLTMRSWTPEIANSKTPTHVNLYEAHATKQSSGLDREGMILIALMSGGDYIPEGVPGCGIKTACEAARAGFGRDLCQLSRRDTFGLEQWRERLVYELRTNESKFFRTKHLSLTVPEDFPNKEVLGYYTHPAISGQDGLSRLRQSLSWDQNIDLPALRAFTAEAFDWRYISGARHFVRNMASALVNRELRIRGERNSSNDDLVQQEQDESRIVQTIHGKREHKSTDNTTELRAGIIPIKIAPIDLDAEEPVPDDERPGLEADDEAEMEAPAGQLTDVPGSPSKKRAPTQFDPTTLERVWILDTWMRVGVPLKVQDWEESNRDPVKHRRMKAATKTAEQQAGKKKRSATGGMQRGALDPFTRVTKPVSRPTSAPEKMAAASQPSAIEEVDLSILSPPRPRPTTRQPPSPSPALPRQTSNPEKRAAAPRSNARQTRDKNINNPIIDSNTTTIISLLSSPLRPTSPRRSPPLLSPPADPPHATDYDLPLSPAVNVSRRRKRTSLQRSQTAPTARTAPTAAVAAGGPRPLTPPLPFDAHEDIASSPNSLPSPSQFRSNSGKRSRTTAYEAVPDALPVAQVSTPRRVRQTPEIIDISSSSPAAPTPTPQRQRTLYTWLSPPPASPSKILAAPPSPTRRAGRGPSPAKDATCVRPVAFEDITIRPSPTDHALDALALNAVDRGAASKAPVAVESNATRGAESQWQGQGVEIIDMTDD